MLLLYLTAHGKSIPKRQNCSKSTKHPVYVGLYFSMRIIRKNRFLSANNITASINIKGSGELYILEQYCSNVSVRKSKGQLHKKSLALLRRMKYNKSVIFKSDRKCYITKRKKTGGSGYHRSLTL